MFSPHSSSAYTVTTSLPAFTFGYFTTYDLQLAAECFLQTTYVEVETTCPDPSTCRATRIRRSRAVLAPQNATPLDINGSNIWNWLNFAPAFLGSVVSMVYRPMLLDYFVAGPDNPTGDIRPTNDWSRMRPPPHIYSVRLGQSMNTYWTCTTGAYSLSGVIMNGTSFLDTNTSFELDDSYATAIGQD